MQKLAYIAGPYRADTIHGIVQNIRKAEAVAIKYWKKDMPSFVLIKIQLY